MTHGSNRSDRRVRRGFTLLELMVSCAVMAVIMVGVMSSVLIAGRGVNHGAPDKSALVAGNVASLIATELRTALSVTELTPTAVTFTVPPRNGDAAPETIRYAWSGTSGAAVTRQYNGGAAANMIDSVQSFQLTYTRSSTTTTASTESAEQTLWSYAGVLLSSSSQLTTTNWIGQVITPSIPVNATSWRVTRVQYQGQQDGGATGQFNVQVRTVSGGVPTNTIVDGVGVSESSLPVGAGWVQAPFNNAGGLKPGSSAAIVFQYVSGSPAGDVIYQSLLSILAGGNAVTTTNGGSSWSNSLLASMLLYVYGTYTVPSSTTTYNLQLVNVSLKTGTSASEPTVTTAVRILNQPAVAAP
jgi:prepilin-type N-terminal cleavage/methylation domain-containing protein